MNFQHIGGVFDKNSNSIIINLLNSSNSKWRTEFDDSPQGKNIYFYELYFKNISVVLLHELVHHIQHVIRHEKTGNYEIPHDWNSPKKYYKCGWEQQAYAIQYLEQLRQDLKVKTPEEMLGQLRSLGLIKNQDLNKLKHTDYKSWKAVMKQAIMTAVADVDEGKPLPWQT